MQHKAYKHKHFKFIFGFREWFEIIPFWIKWTSANPEEVSDDIVDLLGCKLEEIIHASGKLV
jgi:hypothetical protein